MTMKRLRLPQSILGHTLLLVIGMVVLLTILNLGIILFQRGERARAMPYIGKAAESGDAHSEQPHRAGRSVGAQQLQGDRRAGGHPRCGPARGRLARCSKL